MVSLWPLVALFPLAFGTETCDASARPFKMRVKDDFFSPEEVAQLIAAFGTLELLPCPAGGWASRSVPLKVAGLATWIDGMDRSSYHVPAPAALAERFAAEVGASVLPRNLFIRPGSLEDAHIDEAAESLRLCLSSLQRARCSSRLQMKQSLAARGGWLLGRMCFRMGVRTGGQCIAASIRRLEASLWCTWTGTATIGCARAPACI